MTKVSDVVAPYYVQQLANKKTRPVAPLLEVIELNPRKFSNPPTDDELVSFVPMKAVEEESGHLDPSEARPWSEVRKGYTPFEEGDVLFAKITPCMENGKYALAQGLVGGRAAGSTEFHVLRPKPSLDSKYLLYYLLRIELRQSARQSMRGAAGQLRVPPIFFEGLSIPLPSLDEQRRIVAEIEEQLSRIEAGVAALKRVQANLKRYERATVIDAIQGPTTDSIQQGWSAGKIGDFAVSLDHLRRPVNKTERARRPGTIPYLGANGQTGWIDTPLFDEELVLVVEDETFVGRTAPFSYYFSGPCWVNNHAHVLRAKRDKVLPKYFNLALAYYPFIPLTTGSTGRKKLTKKALTEAPISFPPLDEQQDVIEEVDRRLSVVEELETQVHTNLARAERLRQTALARAFALDNRSR